MNAGGTAWWPLTRKVRAALAIVLGTEAVAVAGELTTGTPGWPAIIGGAIIAGAGLVAAYLTQDASSPAP